MSAEIRDTLVEHIRRGSRTFATCALAISLLLLAACNDGTDATGGNGDSEEAGPQSLTLRLNFLPLAQQTPWFYGVQEGFYEEEGIDLEILDGSGSQAAIDDVTAKNVDMALGESPGLILSIAQGREIVSVGMAYGKGAYGIFADEGVGADALEDLEGQSVLVTPGSPETPLMPAVLGTAGLEEEAVRLVNVDAAAKLSAYLDGRGDAMAAPIPAFNALVQTVRPSDAFLFNDAGVVLPGLSFIAHRDTLDSSPELIEAFLRATYRSILAAMDQPEDAVQAMVDARPGEIELEQQLPAWMDFHEFICSDDQEGQPVGVHSEADWESGVELLETYMDLESDSEPSSYYTNQFFEGDEPVSETEC